MRVIMSVQSISEAGRMPEQSLQPKKSEFWAKYKVVIVAVGCLVGVPLSCAILTGVVTAITGITLMIPVIGVSATTFALLMGGTMIITAATVLPSVYYSFKYVHDHAPRRVFEIYSQANRAS